MLNICFISGHYFGYSTLEGMLNNKKYGEQIRVNSLLSLSSDYKEHTVGFCDFAELAKRYNIKHNSFNNVKDPATKQHIIDSNPDFIFGIGLSQLIPADILNIPKSKLNMTTRYGYQHGCIGIHPTLLPVGRGRAPLPWTLIKGLTISGVTAFFLEDTVDSGAIIYQEKVEIDPRETATTLFEKMANLHQIIGENLIESISCGKMSWVEQQHEKATYWPKRLPKDSYLSFNQTVIIIDRFIRALADPYPNAFFYYAGRKVLVKKAAISREHSEGKVSRVVKLSKKGLPFISTLDGVIEIEEIEPMDLKFEIDSLIE